MDEISISPFKKEFEESFLCDCIFNCDVTEDIDEINFFEAKCKTKQFHRETWKKNVTNFSPRA